jgi:hypothetical protein
MEDMMVINISEVYIILIIGNPWILITSALAEVFYRAAEYALDNKNHFLISDGNKMKYMIIIFQNLN